MRPLKLAMQAFGPFLNKVEIPFEKLGRANIYLISGVTGSGKTTIFDAICFALFNSSSGSNRGNSTLKSHYANDNIESYVEFEFLFNDEKYKIIRYPSYERKKQRKEGFVVEQSKAQLYLPDGKIIEKVKDVDDYIVNLLGVNLSQFSQIALLAQGEFLKLLNSDTQNRAEIFRNIFKTWDYSKFQDKLKEKTVSYKNEYENCKSSILQHIFDIIPIFDEIKDLKEKYLENACFDDLNSMLNLLEKQNSSDNEEIIKIQNVVNDFDNQIKVLHEEFIKIQNKINLQNQKQTLISDLEKNEPQFLIVQKQYSNLNQKKKELENLAIRLQKVQDDYKKILEINKLKDINLSYEKELSDIFSSFEESYFALFCVIINYIKSFYFNIKEINNELETEQKKLNELQKLVLEKNNEYQNAFLKYLNIQAGIIASTLEDGKPCPVCGALSHPNPALLSCENLTKENVDNLKNEADLINKDAFEKSKKCSLLKEKLDILTKDFNKILSRYNASCTLILDDFIKINYEEYIEKLENEIDLKFNNILDIFSNIKANNAKISAFNKNIEALDEEKIKKEFSDLSCKLEKLKTEINDIETNYIDLSKKIDSIKSNILLIDNQLNEYCDVSIQKYDEIVKLQDEIAQKLLKLNENINQISIRKAINEKTILLIKEKYKKFNQISKSYSDYKILSDCANGNLVSKQKITFEQYIQGYYLDMVLFEANKRLKIMTQNQFQLMRKKDITSYQSKNALDIEVMDFHTFKKRSTKTLSGGESFKASLALALGLSDCISNMSGAMNMDSLFIDEGFGSLDSESLELAMDVIFALSQNRLIGIISHIDDLKSKVENQIITTKSEFGSKLEIKF